MSKANTYIQRAADLLCTIDNDSETQAEFRKKQEQRWHDLQVLRRYEAYRRGAGSFENCPPPKVVTASLERAIRELKNHFQP